MPSPAKPARTHRLRAHTTATEVFVVEKKEGNTERGKKRGRVPQWQTQSVMQDYSVSFSTAIDVVFVGETQGFSKCSRLCYPCSVLKTMAEGGGGWRGFSPCDLLCLMAAISIGGGWGFHGAGLDSDMPCTP